jgi:hypothetical protein
MKKGKKNPGHTIRAFMMFYIDALDSPAWRAMSHGAKALYLRLRRRYNATIDNNGKIYLPQRLAALEVNSDRNQIARWFRELQYYGFIVKTSAGHLGVHGHGRPPCWRLTELPCNSAPPTLDYLAWNGVPFSNQKTESWPRNHGHDGCEITAIGTGFQKVPHGREITAMGPAAKSRPNIDSSSHN